jgi:NAD(P) transhydrogenase subunit alpha
MKIAVPRESRAGERRVSLVPESVERLVAKRVEVAVESGAGAAAGFGDESYEAAGAALESSADAVVGSADLVVRIHPPSLDEIARINARAAHVSLLFPLINNDLVTALNDRGVTAIALDRMPRTTLAQSMDVLSSQATVAGYRSVIVAAAESSKIGPLLMTPAGRIEPAKFVILGAGVAGLVAIGIARRLGTVVKAYDVRSAVKEQVESLGATFIDVPTEEGAEASGGYAKEISADQQARTNAVIADHLADADAVITTALVPGRPSPRLITAAMVGRMQPGSVIVDIAAAHGGNCELTRPGETVESGGVKIIGPPNLPSDIPRDASNMFSRNVEKLLLYMLTRDATIEFDFEKEIVKSCVVAHEGMIVDEQVAALID